MTLSMLSTAAARDRWTPVALLVLAAGGWAWSIRAATADSMAGMQGMAGMVSPPALAALPGFLFGWVVMMAAMMFPAILPVVRLYGLAAARERAAPKPVFVAGYLAVWAASGIPAFFAWRALAPSIASPEPWIGRFAGAVLLLAAAYQWTPFQSMCLRHCRSPLAFFAHHGGTIHTSAGAFRAGAAHGAFCLGCCWALMAVLVAFGTMHLGWMAALAALILLEKVAPRGEAIGRAAGAAFAVLGIALLLSPDLLIRLL